MKKMYEAPKAEKVEFRYEDTVVASGTPKCVGHFDTPTDYNFKPDGSTGCNVTTGDPTTPIETENG